MVKRRRNDVDVGHIEAVRAHRSRSSVESVLEREPLRSRGRFESDRSVLDHAAAAERHRLAAHRSRARLDDARHPDPLEADAGFQRDVDAGHRPRVDRRARAAREGHQAPREQDSLRPRPRRVHEAGVGVERALGQPDQRARKADGLLARLGARAVHDGRSLEPRGARGVRPAVRRRPDLSCEADDQLGSGQRDRGLGSRGRYRRRERLAVVDQVSDRRRWPG